MRAWYDHRIFPNYIFMCADDNEVNKALEHLKSKVKNLESRRFYPMKECNAYEIEEIETLICISCKPLNLIGCGEDIPLRIRYGYDFEEVDDLFRKQKLIIEQKKLNESESVCSDPNVFIFGR